MEFDRAHYRITYPLGARPKLDWAGRSCVVLDVSEFGLRFLPLDKNRADLGTAVVGTLSFESGQTVDIDGVIVWLFKGQVGVQLHVPLPYPLIIDEQLYLQRRFPALR